MNVIIEIYHFLIKHKMCMKDSITMQISRNSFRNNKYMTFFYETRWFRKFVYQTR